MSQAFKDFLAALPAATGLAATDIFPVLEAGVTKQAVPDNLPAFIASGGSAAKGMVPTPGATAGTERVLHEDAIWRTPATKKTIALTDAATVAIDLSLGDFFTLLTTAAVGATRKLGNPTNAPPAGYVRYVTIQITQSATGSNAATYDTAYKFSTTNPSPTLSTANNAVDRLVFLVDTSGNMHLVGIDLGGS